jgi:hypothetical protein
MTRASRYWTAAIVLVVLGVALQHVTSKGARPIANGEPEDHAVGRVPSTNLDQSNGVKAELSSGSHPSGADRASGPVAGQTLVNPDTTEGKHARQVFGTDRSVIGTPFAVSASVATMCTSDKIICPHVYKKLAGFTEEPRDNAWASEAEADIQNQIESLGPDKYSIRNLECRTTICAVEVSSVSDHYLGMAYYYMVKYGLSQDLGTIGAYEMDPLGARIDVTLMTFTRHQHMCWNKPCDLSSMTPPP